jgi:hypothetical protein
MRATCAAIGVLFLTANLFAGEQSPEAKAIVEKAIKAHGGAEKLNKFKNWTWKTKGEAYMGDAPMPFTAEYVYSAPLNFRYDFDINIGEDKPFRFTGCTVGKTGWTKSGDVVDDLEKVKRESMNQNVHTMELSLLTPLMDKEYTLTSLGESKHENQTLVGIKVGREGYKDVSMFFDKETGLFVKNSTTIFDADHAKKDVKQDAVFSDHREKDGLKVFGKITIYHDGKKFIVEELTEHKIIEKDDPFAKPTE